MTIEKEKHGGHLEQLRARAAALPVLQLEGMSGVIRKSMLAHREDVVLHGDRAALEDFLERATDIEVMLGFSEASLRAPLSEMGFNLYMHLTANVFTSLGVELPDDILNSAKCALDPQEEQMLERLRRDLRRGQLKQARQTAGTVKEADRGRERGEETEKVPGSNQLELF
jgi:hypothetical protein